MTWFFLVFLSDGWVWKKVFCVGGYCCTCDRAKSSAIERRCVCSGESWTCIFIVGDVRMDRRGDNYCIYANVDLNACFMAPEIFLAQDVVLSFAFVRESCTEHWEWREINLFASTWLDNIIAMAELEWKLKWGNFSLSCRNKMCKIIPYEEKYCKEIDHFKLFTKKVIIFQITCLKYNEYLT